MTVMTVFSALLLLIFSLDAIFADTEAQTTLEPLLNSTCIENCISSFVNNLNISSQQQICSQLDRYESCVKMCPQGETIWNLARGQYAVSFATLEEICGRGRVPTAALVELVKTVDYHCIQECREGVSLDNLTNVIEICGKWNGFTTCIRQCDNGEVLMQRARQFVPDLFETIDKHCGNSSAPSSLETINPTALGVKDVGTICAYNCTQTMHTPIRTSRDTMCKDYNNYKTCFLRCPDGDKLWNSVMEMSPTIFNFMTDFCTNEEFYKFEGTDFIAPLIPCALDCRNEVVSSPDCASSPRHCLEGLHNKSCAFLLKFANCVKQSCALPNGLWNMTREQYSDNANVIKLSCFHV